MTDFFLSALLQPIKVTYKEFENQLEREAKDRTTEELRRDPLAL